MTHYLRATLLAVALTLTAMPGEAMSTGGFINGIKRTPATDRPATVIASMLGYACLQYVRYRYDKAKAVHAAKVELDSLLDALPRVHK